MKTYDITVIKIGYVTIKAETSEDALKIAESMKNDDFEWMDADITDCQEI